MSLQLPQLWKSFWAKFTNSFFLSMDVLDMLSNISFLFKLFLTQVALCFLFCVRMYLEHMMCNLKTDFCFIESFFDKYSYSIVVNVETNIEYWVIEWWRPFARVSPLILRLLLPFCNNMHIKCKQELQFPQQKIGKQSKQAYKLVVFKNTDDKWTDGSDRKSSRMLTCTSHPTFYIPA